MKFALVEGRRREAEPKLQGECHSCGSAMVPKCGERRMRHWAHYRRSICDHWWEPETVWHRDWKNRFPNEWQEVRHRDENGVIHIADVRTNQDRVIEFQHSYLNPSERRSREAFYGSRMIWVVNGLRRSRDQLAFERAIRESLSVSNSLVPHPVHGALIRDWCESAVPVFFDFGEPILWQLGKSRLRLRPVLLADFLSAFRDGTSLHGMQFAKLNLPASLPPRLFLKRSLSAFDYHLERKRRFERRF